MKKVLSMFVVALLVAGTTTVMAGECTGCKGKKKGDEKKADTAAHQQTTEQTQASASA